MAPTNLLRAVFPLRSSSPFVTPITSILNTTISRAASTTTFPTTSTPSSLRTYPYTIKTGTVVSVGRMDHTVRVAHRHTTFDRRIRKLYPKVTTYLVADPRDSLREGDVIEFSSGYPKSRNVRHVVERIVAPFGSAIEERPPVMTREERDAARAEKRAAKLQRRGSKRLDQEHVGRIRALVNERVSEDRDSENFYP